ncbi:MAG TPA: hypothetical protein VGK61_10150 [Planctomycetota bacterium]
MKRTRRGSVLHRWAAAALLALPAYGCVGPEAGSEAMILGTIMFVGGCLLGVALIYSLNN